MGLLVYDVGCGVVMVDKNMLVHGVLEVEEVSGLCPCKEGSVPSCDGGGRGVEGDDRHAQGEVHESLDQGDEMVGGGRYDGVMDDEVDDCFGVIWGDENGEGSEARECVEVLQGGVQGALQGDGEVPLNDGQGSQGACDCQIYGHPCRRQP